MKKLIRELCGVWLLIFLVFFVCAVFAFCAVFAAFPLIFALNYSWWYIFISILSVPMGGLQYVRVLNIKKIDDLGCYTFGLFK